jgi:hypothetical protein
MICTKKLQSCDICWRRTRCPELVTKLRAVHGTARIRSARRSVKLSDLTQQNNEVPFSMLVAVFPPQDCATWCPTLRVLRVLRAVFELAMKEVTGDRRKLHDELLRDLHSSPECVEVIKPRIIRSAGHVARMGKWEVHTYFSWEI